MKRLLRPSFARAVLSTLCLAVTGMAQSTAFDTATMTAALSLREDVAKAVREKRDPVAGALARLKAAASPSGLKLDRDTDFALATVDVGQRLLAAGDPESAEPFFREAEKSLDAVIEKTPDNAARDKAAFLQKRAWVRSRFLGKPKDAKADLEAAVRLRPGDKPLQQQREQLVTEHGPEMMGRPPHG